MTTWPSTLPAPLAENFRETAPDNVIRTQMDTGAPKTRLRSTAVVRKMAMTFLLSAGQTEALDDFFMNDLMYGALKFDFTHPRTGETVACRFIKPPEYLSTNGLYHRVAAEMEVLP